MEDFWDKPHHGKKRGSGMDDWIEKIKLYYLEREDCIDWKVFSGLF